MCAAAISIMKVHPVMLMKTKMVTNRHVELSLGCGINGFLVPDALSRNPLWEL
jgi:hypothetical protein